MSRIKVKKLQFEQTRTPYRWKAEGTKGSEYHVSRSYSPRQPGYGLIEVPPDVAEQEKKDAPTKGLFDAYISRLWITDSYGERAGGTSIGQYIGIEAATAACQAHFEMEVWSYLEEDRT